MHFSPKIQMVSTYRQLYFRFPIDAFCNRLSTTLRSTSELLISACEIISRPGAVVSSRVNGILPCSSPCFNSQNHNPPFWDLSTTRNPLLPDIGCQFSSRQCRRVCKAMHQKYPPRLSKNEIPRKELFISSIGILSLQPLPSMTTFSSSCCLMWKASHG